MPLHVFRVDGPGRRRTAPVELQFELLQVLEPVFGRFRQITGIRLSEYDDAKLSLEHLRLLLQMASGTPASRATELQMLARLVNEAPDEGSYFIAQGE